jgi:hypothetical protein
MPIGQVQVQGPSIAGITETAPEALRADFKPGDFARAIDQHGARFAWARSMRCACRPTNRQTQQPNPACERCRGSGWMLFGDRSYQIPAAVGQLDAVQRAIVADANASVIRGILTGLSQQVEPYERIGERLTGAAMLSVRDENKLSFYDRLVDLDSEMTFSEVVEVEWSKGVTPRPLAPKLRYRPIGITLLVDENGVELYSGETFELGLGGEFRWIGGNIPRAGTRVGVHYLHHTTYRVIEWPHIMRRAQPRTNIPAAQRTTPLGTPSGLPRQAVVRLEHLVDGVLAG